MIDKHNERVKKEESWDPEGHANVPTIKRNKVRDPTFLDDDSVKGSIDDSKDRNKLGELVVENRSKNLLIQQALRKQLKNHQMTIQHMIYLILIFMISK